MSSGQNPEWGDPEKAKVLEDKVKSLKRNKA